MDSLFSNLYLTLQAKLATITAIKLIAEDTGQLQDQQPALQYPCVLLNFDDVHPSQMGQNCQMGRVNILFKLVTDVYSSTSSITAQLFKEKGLNYLEIENSIHQAFQGYSPSDDTVPLQEGEAQPPGWGDTFGALDRISTKTNKSRDDLRIREIIYSLGFEDYGTAEIQETAPVYTFTVTEDITV